MGNPVRWQVLNLELYWVLQRGRLGDGYSSSPQNEAKRVFCCDGDRGDCCCCRDHEQPSARENRRLQRWPVEPGTTRRDCWVESRSVGDDSAMERGTLCRRAAQGF